MCLRKELREVMMLREYAMKINDLYSNYAGNAISGDLRASDAQGGASGPQKGDVLEGIVTDIGKSVKISFEQLNNKEISFDAGAVKNAYAGQIRRFEVVEAGADRIVLKDLDGIGAEVETRSIFTSKVDTGLVQMVNDFSETMGDKKEEDEDEISRLSDEDYSELKAEGFSIEEFKAERLVRAIARIKTNRAAKEQSIEEAKDMLADNRRAIRRQAAKAAADKYGVNMTIVTKLIEADLPITDGNVTAIIGSVMMSGEAVRMNDNSFAYLMKNSLEPTAGNIYRSVYSGSIKRSEINPTDWQQLEPAVKKLVDDTAASGETAAPAAVHDARWLMEYDIPVTGENLLYKKELEHLRDTGCSEDEAAAAAVRALARTGNAEDAVLIASHETVDGTGRHSIDELTGRLNLQQIRLSMAAAADTVSGLAIDLEPIRRDIEALKNEIEKLFGDLAEELGIDENAGVREPEKLSADTVQAVKNIAEAPVTLYGMTFAVRERITLAELGSAAVEASAKTPAQDAVPPILSKAFTEYGNAATEVRPDLGDSIKKAFGSVDTLLEDTGAELNDANRRAVRILGYNSMEITAENIEKIKYYDFKVTSMIDRMKPSVVMSMIGRGFNPLDSDIDTVNAQIDRIMDEEGIPAEERFSEFLVKLESRNEIPEEVRDAYIGMYRLFYRIEQSDGAVLAAALNSGRKLTLKNLLTEARSRAGRGIDETVGDDTETSAGRYVNSITDQIESGFAFAAQKEYLTNLVKRAARVTGPEVWESAVPDTDADDMTLEQAALKIIETDDAEGMPDTAAAAGLRAEMLAAAPAGNLLRSLGLNDGAKNRRVLTEELEAADNGDDSAEKALAVKVDSKDNLLKIMDSELTLNAAVQEALDNAKENARLEFLGNIAIISKARELNEQLDRYKLLNEMATSGHYRMRLDTDPPSRINLTVVRNAGREGSVSIEVSNETYHVRADLSLTVFENDAAPGGTSGIIDGTVSCDSVRELEALEGPLAGFVEEMKREGFDAGSVSGRLDRISPAKYLSRLGELKRRAGADTAEAKRRRKTDTARLYSVAKAFVAAFI